MESREIILLREFEELSYQEIASLLGCPEGTAMSRLARARSKLRPLLADIQEPLLHDWAGATVSVNQIASEVLDILPLSNLPCATLNSSIATP